MAAVATTLAVALFSELVVVGEVVIDTEEMVEAELKVVGVVAEKNDIMGERVEIKFPVPDQRNELTSSGCNGELVISPLASTSLTFTTCEYHLRIIRSSMQNKPTAMLLV